MEHNIKTPQSFCYIKNTNLCNEENIAKPSTPRYLILKDQTKNNQTNLSKESSSTL
jgi:hypothetical protein